MSTSDEQLNSAVPYDTDGSYLELLGKLVLIMGALLPAVGVIFRSVSLAISNIGPIELIAPALPITALTLHGAVALLPFGMMALFGIPLWKREMNYYSSISHLKPLLSREIDEFILKSPTLDPELLNVLLINKYFLDRFPNRAAPLPSLKTLDAILTDGGPDTQRLRNRISEAIRAEEGRPINRFIFVPKTATPVGLLLMMASILIQAIPLYGALFLPEGPTVVVLFIGALFMIMFGRWRVRQGEPLTVARFWPVIAISIVTGIIAGSITPNGPTAAYYFFREARPTAGWYTELGRWEHGFFLQSCEKPSRQVISVPFDLVTTVLFDSHNRIERNPSLYNILFHDRRFRFGIVDTCPPRNRLP